MTWVVGANNTFVNLDAQSGLNVDGSGSTWTVRLGLTGTTSLPGTYASETEAWVAAQRMVNAVEVNTLTT